MVLEAIPIVGLLALFLVALSPGHHSARRPKRLVVGHARPVAHRGDRGRIQPIRAVAGRPPVPPILVRHVPEAKRTVTAA